MTRTLIIARHAAPNRDRRKYTDFQYPLTAEGEREAHTLGQLLRQRLTSLDALYCSPAVRTVDTAQHISTYFPHTPIVKLDELYSGFQGAIIDVVLSIPDDQHTVMIVGHEPTVSLATEYLAVQRPDLAFGFPTAGAAILTVDTTWYDLGHGLARHEFICGGEQF